MIDRLFGRLVQFDEKSKNFPIRALLPVDKPRRSYTWNSYVCLDQGQEGSCVGHAVAHEGSARPKVIKGITHDTALHIYKQAQKIDEWPGESYEGTSVLAGIKIAQGMKWYGEYRWAFSELDLALAVGYYGPAVLGINWYEGMCNPDANGLIKVSGDVYGGHAILCNGYNVKKGLYRLHNSWGTGWGLNGDCFISQEDMDFLLKDQGEACIPVVRKFV